MQCGAHDTLADPSPLVSRLAADTFYGSGVHVRVVLSLVAILVLGAPLASWAWNGIRFILWFRYRDEIPKRR
ncbi:MAG TPA: hypothetical protein VKM54_04830 [Myxococcota bacterium]|nr:hypothetical protein [Myxococcota bacterium]